MVFEKPIMLLNIDDFSSVIKNAPLISIDLIVKNFKKEILLGKRVNEPAKGCWFVPGGRVFKDETLDEAFNRISKEELSLDIKREESKFYGIYEHFYENNVFNDDFGTHYIVLAHEFMTNDDLRLNDQHEAYKWFGLEGVLNSGKVHKYTKNYFLGRV